MKITDISPNQKSILGLKKLSDREATRIVGGVRNEYTLMLLRRKHSENIHRRNSSSVPSPGSH